MGISEKVVETFAAIDDDGRVFKIQRIEQWIEHHSHPRSNGERFALEGGGAVTQVGKGAFRIAGLNRTVKRVFNVGLQDLS